MADAGGGVSKGAAKSAKTDAGKAAKKRPDPDGLKLIEAGDAATIVGWHDRVKDQEAGHAVWFVYTVLDRWKDLLSRPGAAAVLARSSKGQK